MEDLLKFTGKFKNLKALGCSFHKLYAWNYKVYSKELGGGYRFWIWVANGGYIELNDFYGNTKAIITLLQSINWDEVELDESFFGKPIKRVIIRFNHNDSTKGALLCKTTLEDEFRKVRREYEKEHNLGYEDVLDNDELYEQLRNKVYSEYDRDFRITEERCKELLKVYNELQNS